MSRILSLWQSLVSLSKHPATRIFLTIMGFLILLTGFAIPVYRTQGSEYVSQMLKHDYSALYHYGSIKNGAAAPVTKRHSPVLFASRELEKSTEGGRIQDQVKQVRDRIRRHLGVISFYYSRYYMSVTVSSIFGVISAVSFVFLSIKGWREANRQLLLTFLLSSAIAAFYQMYPSLYKQPENIAANEKLYRAYVSLENDIRSYAALVHPHFLTWCTEGQKEENKPGGMELLCPDAFILDIDKKLAEYNSLTVLIDHKSLEKLTQQLNAIGQDLQ